MNVVEGPVLTHGRCDAQQRLLSAGEPLASLQHRCGGEMPGVLAVPELRRLVRDAMHAGFAITRLIVAQDGHDHVSAWVEADPQPDACTIRVHTWQTTPVSPEEGAAAERRRTLTDRVTAEMSVWLDGSQRILAATTQSQELAVLAAAMQQRAGQCWTDFLPPSSTTHRQPLHWRLLDGAPVVVEGSARTWRVSLIPQIAPGSDPTGFELLLLSDQPPAAICDEEALQPDTVSSSGLIGQELAPVLKQPIARIIANAETIRTRLAGPLPDAYAEYAGEISSAGKLLLDLLEDMADLEVVEGEGFSTTPDYIDLAEVARQAAGILGVRAREKGIVLVPPDADASAPALAEFRRVLQILLNLIGNAIRYCPSETAIRIAVESDGRTARASVSDEGPGLHPDDQARIFEKFERLGRGGDGGSGLGLYISRQLARAMGGELSVQSAPGEGARFVLEVPSDPEG